ncbi:biotin/lipoyl-containing protein, partial [Beijerinckia sp. L45]|uniref:biotin/lipoyl-containing protein n=1 Tax=Beijerinckia sp. L45 TaxID=1641855 RepID=UPI00273811C0
MATEIRVPTLGESVTEATIGRWFKKAGDAVKADEPLLELETDKVTLEVNAPAAGVLAEITAKDGETVEPGGLLGQISEGGAAAAPSTPAKAEAKATAPAETTKSAPAASRAAAAAPSSGTADVKGPSPMPAAPAAAKIAA